ncbi:MAG: MBOAT family protein [Oscillospiraceae bacterium]|nr:MBOAT family protein [Oscillospiraceae bacterium]
MSLLSNSFLYLFLPVTLAVFCAMPRENDKLRGIVLLVSSLFFVFCVQPYSAAVLVCLAVFCWAIGRLMQGKWRKMWLVLGIFVCVCQLCVFKYTAFFAEILRDLCKISLHLPQISAPAGVSFYTFLAIGYLIDVYRKTCEAERSLGRLTLYFAAFPKFMQGPLVRYDAFLLTKPNVSQMAEGAERFIIGMGKKMLLSSAAADVAQSMFTMPSNSLSAGMAWMGAVCYAWQIYFDFAGYTDMAIGVGQMFGMRLSENFNDPYMAQSVTDFWRRWHMTLSRWFRDYVYIPLGGNRKGKARQILNLLIVWLLTGLWHGASWNFVLWGLFFAVALIAEKLFLQNLLEKLPRAVRHIYALFCILIGWVIFRSSDLASVGMYLRAMFAGAPSDGAWLGLVLRQYGIEFAFALVLSTSLGRKVYGRIGAWGRLVVLGAVLVLSLLAMTSSSMQAFVYAQF